jgi:hypothetical protein
MKFVADKTKVKVKGKAFGEIEVETEYPQFDNPAELIQSAGSEKDFMAWANRIVKAQSKVGINNLTTKYSADDSTVTAEVAEAKAKEVRRSYSLANSRSGVSKAEKANRFDEVAKLVSGIDLEGASLEDIKAKLEEMKALAAA